MNIRHIVSATVILVLSACGQQSEEPVKTPPKPEKVDPEKVYLVPLKNPGFEAAIDNLAGWKVSQHAGLPSYETAIDTESAGEGKNSFRIKRINKEWWGMVDQQLPLSKQAGKPISLTAKVKGENLAAKGFVVQLIFRKRGGRYISKLTSEPLTGTTDWHTIKIQGKVPPNTGELQVSGVLQDAGTAWFDDIRVYIHE